MAVDIHSLRSKLPRVLNGVGYFAALFAWLPIAMVLLPRLIASQPGQTVLFPTPADTIVLTDSSSAPLTPSVWAYVGAVMVGTVIIGLAIYVIRSVYVPAVITNSERVTSYVAKQGLKAVEKAHHKPIAQHTKRPLTAKLQFGVRVLLAVLPCVGILFIPFGSDITQQMVRLSVYSASLAAVTLFAFGYVLAAYRTMSVRSVK